MLTRRSLLRASLAPTVAMLLPPFGRRLEAQTSLKQGQYSWNPERAPLGPVVVVVSNSDQLTFVYRNGILIGVSTCSTGAAGHRTPTGVFTILQKRVDHYSSTYNNAPMPYMQRLTWRGIALHAGDLPGYPASKGCIRLPMEFATRLYQVTHVGTPIIIGDKRSTVGQAINRGILIPEGVETEAQRAIEKASSGSKQKGGWSTSVTPVIRSIVVSGAERKAVVMLNGKIEAESEVRIDDASRPLGTHAFSLLGSTPDLLGLKWMSLGVGDGAAEGAAFAGDDHATLRRIRLADRQHWLRVAQTYRTGTTLVVTDLAATPDTRSAPDFVVADGEPYRMPRKKKPTNPIPPANSGTAVDWQ